MDINSNKNTKNSIFNKLLNKIETVGNNLPHPITLFTILSLIIIILSYILNKLGFSAIGELINPSTLEIEEKTFFVNNLLSLDGISHIIKNFIPNFINFAPLGIVLVTMLGVGCAENSGYISAFMRKVVLKTSAKFITPVLIFLGVLSNVASDIGYVVLIPLGAIVFMNYGKNPLVGIAAVFAGVSGGFSANILIGVTDSILAGISSESARILDESYNVTLTSNWYFMIVSTFLIVILGTIVTNKIIEPRLGNYNSIDKEDLKFSNLNSKEEKALKYANLSLIIFILLLTFLSIPKNSIFRNSETGSLISNSLLMDGIIIFITLAFFIPAIVYGKVSGTYKSEKDICNSLGESMSSMGSYIALSFVMAQFISYFNETNLGSIFALKGSNFLERIGLQGPLLMLIFVLLTAFINLFMGSASAKWAILAPVFIPMFMKLGYSPELTQVAYRIGDSITNIISPLMTYFAMVVTFVKKYDKNSGIGTLVSLMIPYSIVFFIGWSFLLVLWMFLNLPLGF